MITKRLTGEGWSIYTGENFEVLLCKQKQCNCWPFLIIFLVLHPFKFADDLLLLFFSWQFSSTGHNCTCWIQGWKGRRKKGFWFRWAEVSRWQSDICYCQCYIHSSESSVLQQGDWQQERIMEQRVSLGTGWDMWIVLHLFLEVVIKRKSNSWDGCTFNPLSP